VIKGMTEAEFKEFMEGSKCPYAGGATETKTEENALKLPYNVEYEIPKDKLHIGIIHTNYKH